MWHGQMSDHPCRVFGVSSLLKRRMVRVGWSNMSRPARLVSVERYSAFAQTKNTHNLTWAFTFTHVALWTLKRFLISKERIYFDIWVFTYIHNINRVFRIVHFPNLAFERNIYNEYNNKRKWRTFVAWTLKSINIQSLIDLILFIYYLLKQIVNNIH